MNLFKNLKKRWQYNKRSNITNRTFIAEKIEDGFSVYAASVSYMDWKGNTLQDIRQVSFCNIRKQWTVSIGGLTWLNDKYKIKEALDNHIKLNLDFEEGYKEPEIKYTKYP